MPMEKITDVNEASIKVIGVERKIDWYRFLNYFTDPIKHKWLSTGLRKSFVTDYPNDKT
jgi:hypothetical protein